MEKNWIKNAISLLTASLGPVPHELNEIDWKEELSPKTDKLIQHLAAFANLPGGGYLVFGIENKTGNLKGIDKKSAEVIIEKLSSLGRDTLDPLVAIDHSIQSYQGKPLLFVHIKESAVKPVHLVSGSIEESFIRTGGCTRKASRQEVGGLMLNSKTPHFEELNASKLKVYPDIMESIDYRTIFKLLKRPVPQTNDELFNWMGNEKMISPVDGSGAYITNFGALAAANDIKDFDGLSRKAIRLIKYKGVNKIETEREYLGAKGYTIGFEGLVTYIKALLPIKRNNTKCFKDGENSLSGNRASGINRKCFDTPGLCYSGCGPNDRDI